MRIIGGEFRSRVLKSLPGLEVRPTPDRMRESLFSILAPRISGAVFLDLYAGTGAVGMEALSRGAERALFVENNLAAVEVIRFNLKSLGLEKRGRVWVGRAGSVIPKIERADIAFLDPPYPLEQEYEKALMTLAEEPPGMVIAQHSSRFGLQESYGGLKRGRVVRQGDNSLSFFG
ncbi:MAG: 16S rRNA (guanine(966)-N(2))-methyltransferase RsmD [Bryobacteraceae bacterium]|jgi:16S rRNA (guanine966-N2)-methyltransferase